MRALYAIVTREQVDTYGSDISLRRACEQKGIDYRRLVVEDVVLDDLRHMQIPAGSLLYRVSLDTKAVTIETLLATLYPDKLTTVYYPQVLPHPHRKLRELSRQMAQKLPIIPTIVLDERWETMADEEITTRLQQVDGFPVVVKTLGRSHGEGVQLAHDIEEFKQCIKKVPLRDCQVIARKYLAEYRHYRLIVVAGKVVAVIEYLKPDDDFRTNASAEPMVRKIDQTELDPAIIDIALKGTALRASVLGGVDVLVDSESGRPYLAEVNVPCYFPRAEAPTGIDIAGILIDAMVGKANEEHND